ncbi:MAG: hypothetical protein R8M38_01590 [Mariprofundaceae bacterium]
MSEKKKLTSGKLLILALIVIVAAIAGPMLSYLKATKSDAFKVEKQKITREQQDEFMAKVDAMVKAHTVRLEGEHPIVRPPAGSDIYIPAKNYDWGGFTLELKKGATYQLHITALDVKHALIVRKLKLMHRAKKGEIKTIAFIPPVAGTFEMLCGDYCGPGHAKMTGNIIVVE